MPDASINSVQFIYTTLPAGSNVSNDNTGTITISSVITDQTMIIAQCRNPNNSRRGVASFELTSSTEITYHRYDDRSAIEVNLYVIEWDSNVSVQHGHESTLAGDGTGLNDITITSVDTTKSLVFHSVCSAGSSGRNRNNLTAAYLTSGTNLRFDRNYLSGTDAVHVGWQVIEFPSGTVQSGTTTVTGTDLTNDVTITAVSDTSNTFVHHSLTSDNADNKETDGYPDVSLTSTTNLRVERWLADEDITVAYQVAEIPNWTVQRVENTFSGAGNIENQTITSVDTDNAFSMGYRSSFGGQSQSGTDQSSLGGSSNNANRTMHCLNEITSATNLEFYRSVSTFNASFVAYVIDVAAASSGAQIILESITLSSDYKRNLGLSRRVLESISMLTSIRRNLGLTRTLQENVNISSLNRFTLGLVRFVFEGLTLSENSIIARGIIRFIKESVNITSTIIETITSIGSLILNIINENVSITSSYKRNLGLVRSNTSTIGVTEITNRLAGLVRNVLESVNISTTIKTVRGLVRKLTETISINSNNSSILGLLRTITEAINISSTVKPITGLVRIINEVINITSSIITTTALVVYSYVGYVSLNVSQAIQYTKLKVTNAIDYVKFKVNGDVIDND